MKISLFVLILGVTLSYGQICEKDCSKKDLKYDDDDYYRSAYKCIKKRDLECLKQEISLIINQNVRVLDECCLWDVLSDTDHDSDEEDNVVLLFTETTRPKSQRQNQTNAIGTWNKHHLWPKSRGANSPAAIVDIHQIRPCDAQVGSLRGNKDFKSGGNSICLEPYNATSDCAINTSFTRDTFEVPEVQKGDVARMLFYMVHKYTDLNLSLDDVTDGPTQLGWKSDLIQWAIEDDVDDFEKARNERIFKYQQNRNPFIDHPEWIEYIYVDGEIPPQPGLTTAGIILIVIIGVLHILSLLLCFLQSVRSGTKEGHVPIPSE